MKMTAVKKISAVIFCIIIMFSASVSAFAETIQDRVERELNEMLEQYNSSDPATQEQLQSDFSAFLEEYGLDDIDLGSIAESDIGAVIGEIGNMLALDEVFALVGDAWASGTDMIEDVINGGLGTSDGSNTATTNANPGSPNVIIAATSPAGTTGAVGIPSTAPSVTAPTTNNSGEATTGNLVGPGVTTAGTTAPAVSINDEMSTSSVAVLVVLSVSTIAVIVAIVIFFVLKKK